MKIIITIFIALTLFGCDKKRQPKTNSTADSSQTFIGRQSLGQASIDDVSYKQTCSKCRHFILNINIHKNEIEVKYSTTKIDIDTAFTITTSQHEQIINSIKNISVTDIIANMNPDEIGMDGGEYTIEFGTYENKISYKIWSPTLDTDRRKLTNFVDACRQIIKLANLNSADILR